MKGVPKFVKLIAKMLNIKNGSYSLYSLLLLGTLLLLSVFCTKYPKPKCEECSLQHKIITTVTYFMHALKTKNSCHCQIAKWQFGIAIV